MSVSSHVIDHLLVQCLGHDQAYHELRDLCDTIGGRTSGTRSGCAAEEWAWTRLASYGLEADYEQFGVRVWSRGPLEAELLDDGNWRIAALAHGNTPDYADLSAPVVDVGHGELEQFERVGKAVRDKFALCDEGSSPGKRVLHRSEKLALAEQFGAAGLLIRSSLPGLLPRTGVCSHKTASIPSLGISMEDGERLLRAMGAGSGCNVRIRMRNAWGEGTARNVIATLPGQDDAEMVLAGAHVDSWDVGQGAIDNGLGCAIVLGAARALATLETLPRRSIVFALWAAEETGILGSYDYARRHRDSLQTITALMNFDMTGEPFGYWVPGRSEPPAILRELAEQLSPIGMQQEFDFRAGLHSDHQPFLLAGVPVISLLSKLPHEAGRWYHSAGDTFDKVSRPALSRAVLVTAVTLWALANEEKPSMTTLSRQQVYKMIEDADLLEALRAEGTDLSLEEQDPLSRVV